MIYSLTIYNVPIELISLFFNVIDIINNYILILGGDAMIKNATQLVLGTYEVSTDAV